MYTYLKVGFLNTIEILLLIFQETSVFSSVMALLISHFYKGYVKAPFSHELPRIYLSLKDIYSFCIYEVIPHCGFDQIFLVIMNNPFIILN